MPNADDMLSNAAARAGELAAPGLDPRPRRKVAVLACMDTRIDLFPMLGLERGDAHIIRNAGGLVTDDVIRSLTASQRLLGTEEIVVVMHDGCGLHGASEYELGAFDDLEATLRESLARLRACSELPARDHIRGFIFDPETGALREVDARRGRPPGRRVPRTRARPPRARALRGRVPSSPPPGRGGLPSAAPLWSARAGSPPRRAS